VFPLYIKGLYRGIEISADLSFACFLGDALHHEDCGKVLKNYKPIRGEL
jgi:hypothetical protein